MVRTRRTAQRLLRAIRELETDGWLSARSRRDSPLDHVAQMFSMARARACHQGPAPCADVPGDPPLEALLNVLADRILEAQALGEIESSPAADAIARGMLAHLVRHIDDCDRTAAGQPTRAPDRDRRNVPYGLAPRIRDRR